MSDIWNLAAALIALAAVFGWLNARVLRLPHLIGLLMIALLSSLAVVLFDVLVPSSMLREAVTSAVQSIDFHETLMRGMLAFLLFAGALHVDLGRLREARAAVALLATAGVIVSTAIVGLIFWAAAAILGINMPLIWALVFGALIAPTDPVAVLSLLKTVSLPQRLETKIAGESLLNDGVGVVVFTLLVSIAVRPGDVALYEVGIAFLREAGGGAVLGLAVGWIAVRAMEAIDDYPVEILISLAVATGLYALAIAVHMSGPIAVVVAGIIVGNRGARTAMSELTREYLFQFWQVIDELLNSVLFLLIGLEVLVIRFDPSLAGLAVAAIPITLMARFASVWLAISSLSLWRTFTRGSIPVLTWGGVHGGISVALALSLPFSAVRGPILAATYVVVIFSIVVQGLTIAPLVRRVAPPE